MAKTLEQILEGKFVLVFDDDTRDWGCCKDSSENPKHNFPSLFDSVEEAFIEKFDSNCSMLESHMEDGMLEEYNEGVTPELVKEMGELLQKKDIAAMKKFMEDHPECDNNGEWIEPADSFFSNRKHIFNQGDFYYEGVKLTDIPKSETYYRN